MVGKLAGCPAAGDSLTAGVLGEFENGALAIRTSGDGNHVGGVLDGGDYSRGKHDLVVGGRDIDQVDSWRWYNGNSKWRASRTDRGMISTVEICG